VIYALWVNSDGNIVKGCLDEQTRELRLVHTSFWSIRIIGYFTAARPWTYSYWCKL